MRKGRFAGLGGRPDAVEPLGLVDLLLVDLLPAGDQDDERIGIERVRSLTHSAVFLMVAHLACGIALLACGAATPNLPGLMLPLTGVLLFDVIFWFATRRERTRMLKPHLVIRLAALYVGMAGALWSLLAFSALDCVTAENGPAIRIALSAGFALPIVAFLPIPSIVSGTTLVAIAATAAFYPHPMFLGIVAALGACLSLFSLYSARDAVLSSNRRLATEWQAEKARRFVVEFEQSGRGWFWETNADGALSYVSDQLAEDFNEPASALLGRQFADLLRVKDIWWSLSVPERESTYGRFLGFRGGETRGTDAGLPPFRTLSDLLRRDGPGQLLRQVAHTQGHLGGGRCRRRSRLGISSPT